MPKMTRLRILLLLFLFLSAIPNLHAADTTALFKAVSQNQFEAVKAILEKNPDLSRSVSKGRMTPLHIASARGHREIVLMLLDKGADVNARTINDSTPLSFAVVNNHLEVAEILRENGGIE